ncbi:MAG: DUF1660 family phage protein [Burkholderiales bacterium]
MRFFEKYSHRLLCRIFGHRWHFLHERDIGGRTYACRRCQRKAVFIR